MDGSAQSAACAHHMFVRAIRAPQSTPSPAVACRSRGDVIHPAPGSASCTLGQDEGHAVAAQRVAGW